MERRKACVDVEFPKTEDWTKKSCEAYKMLYNGTGAGAKMRDWINWPLYYRYSAEYMIVKRTADKIQKENKAVVVVGIGGSYLTSKMILQSEYGDNYNEIANSCGLPRIYFTGCDLSPNRVIRTVELIGDDDWSIVYISKSGGTFEPAASFRFFWKRLKQKYGENANSRVYAITDSKKGILKGMANKYGWETFEIPDGIGGRYSGLTAVGLLPVTIAGINTDAILDGAIEAMKDCDNDPNNKAVRYAEWRYDNYMKGAAVEFLAANTPDLQYFGEWSKQLFGESEGKNGEGLFPVNGTFPTDLHSLGQYLQDGVKGIIFETQILRDFKNDIKISESDLNDNLNQFVGKTFSDANTSAMIGAEKAHTIGGNPCGCIYMGDTLYDIGYTMQMMFVACGVSAYMLGVNPFNQPGVELYKKEMKTVLK